ncbi:hypothetical protein [Rhizobium fabae]|uniref:Uncharacterized protein n=1 Tax=Rhizobium fabae TaxID=573179 RepID=A0A7W6BH75_9HYPH|nr:hypothetical protein [Rhizobium fabae]MBB3918330.1 hypothetical protein [Rhizobium fabae]RUM08575.1 hypothetical protein EFB14_27995 [Rhizobium fabae]
MQRFLLSGLALAALAGAAFAQEPSAAPSSGAAPPPAADAGSPPPPPRDEAMPDGSSRDRFAFRGHGWRGDMGLYRGQHRGPPPSKAARFRIEDGDTRIDLKCAEDEPMKACADLLLQVMDRLQGPAQP